MKKMLLLALQCVLFSAYSYSTNEIKAWEQQAKRVKIIRDKWGIPHIYGKTDADCVFGLMYAQCEDDFQRVEMNYITMLGRTAEVKGESAIYDDLLVKMVIDSTESVKDYQRSPLWMKKLLHAFADGINYYLYKHPNVSPAVLKRFQPWYPLTYTDGSISAIQTADLTAKDIQYFYEGKSIDLAQITSKFSTQLSGSNGFAVAPQKSQSGKAMLYINPHVTFYFRPEVHMVSEEGLNVYGAVTWGQFFVYQGFNANCGWMHTSSNADVADLYAEKVEASKNGFVYMYENEKKPVQIKPTTVYYQSANGIQKKEFPVYFTHHGPIMAKTNLHWLAMKSNNRSLNGLIQSWSRTKAKSFAEFKQIMALRENVSNNTVYADKEGNIAYWHGNFMPKRNPAYDWNKAVDGTVKSTEWQGLHEVDEIVHLYNPKNGWLQNCNSTPFTAAGPGVINAKDYPAYMAPDAENYRGINAVRLFAASNKLDMDGLIKIGYNRYLAAFDHLLPAMLNIKATPGTDLFKAIEVLKSWNKESATESVATTLAIHWAEKMMPIISKMKTSDDLTIELPQLLPAVSDEQKAKFLEEVLAKLKQDFGTWEVKWGDINRFQRIENKLSLSFDDALPSIPSPFASSQWGSLPSYTSRSFDHSKKRYGYGGNSFVCAVEFGDKVRAKSILAGGQSGNPASPHFKDQAGLYTTGTFKEVYFYKEDVLKNMEEEYFPGFKKHN